MHESPAIPAPNVVACANTNGAATAPARADIEENPIAVARNGVGKSSIGLSGNVHHPQPTCNPLKLVSFRVFCLARVGLFMM